VIPTPIAVRTIADLIEYEIARSRGTRAERLSAARDRLVEAAGIRHGRSARGAGAERQVARKGLIELPSEADPAAVGYLCVWVRGHADALVELLAHLDQVHDPRAGALRVADPRDPAAVVLATLGVPPAAS